jgi:hypothetical protein
MDKIQLSPIQVKPDYLKKWNETSRDFFFLTLNEVPIRQTLYRIGGFNYPNPETDKYFLLLKHTEAFYSKDILKITKSANPRHLASSWVIIDSKGNELFEAENYEPIYLIKNSCIYSYKGNYYNIETGESYGSNYSKMESENYLFVNNEYHKDTSKRGVLKVNKLTGESELFQ